MRKINPKQKKFFFLSVFITAAFLAPSNAQAIFGVGDIGLFDIPTMQLDALDFIDNVVMRFLIWAFVLFVESQILVLTAGGILDWATSLQVPLTGDLVQSGWKFMVGLVNLVLLIIFLVIAFASILRIGASQMKKTLSKLIVVALLMNFSLLFVGIFVDIAQILINTLRTAFGGNFVGAALGPLKAMWAGPLTFAATALGLKIGLALVPIGNVASAVATGTVFIADLVLGKGWFLQLIVLTVFNFAAAMIFGLFAFLFIARVVVISLLAVIAPLALAAAAFPRTGAITGEGGVQKYWGQWLHTLVSWSFAGVTGLFLMGLGMKFASNVFTAPSFSFKGANLTENLFGTLFLLSYLVVAFLVTKKLMPKGADMIITPFRKFGGEAVKKLGIPAMAETWRRAGVPVEGWVRGVRTGAEQKRTLPPEIAQQRGFGAQMKRAAFRASHNPLAYWGGRTLGRPVEALGGQATQQMKARDERNVEEAKQKMRRRDSKDLLRIFNAKTSNVTDRMAAVGAMIENGDSDDLLEYIIKGEMSGRGVGETVELARDRLGPPGYRPMIKALGGMIYTEPQRLGIAVKPGETDAYGSPVLQKDWWENTVKREIVEKLQVGEITQMDILGNYMKRFHDYAPDADHPEMSAHWRAGGKALTYRLLAEAGGKFAGVLLQKPGSVQGRQELGNSMQELINSHFGYPSLQDMPDQYYYSLANALKALAGPGARNLGANIGYLGTFSPGDINRKIAEETRNRTELRPRGVTIPTTPQEQSYNTLLEQRTRQQTQLQNLQQELEQRVQQERSRTGVFLPIHQQRIQEIQRDIQQTTQQLGQTEQQIGATEIELGRIPGPPAPLPKIQPSMPEPLKRLINQGDREIQTITEKTRELQRNLADIRDSQADLNEVRQTGARLIEQLNRLTAQEQAGTLAPEFQARLPELREESQRVRDRETVLSREINEYQGLAARARAEILASKQKVDGPDGIRQRIGAQIGPLQRKYETAQRRQQREQRLKQRQERRRTR